MVAGADDIRVAVLENYLLDHALHLLNIPSTLLIFPGKDTRWTRIRGTARSKCEKS